MTNNNNKQIKVTKEQIKEEIRKNLQEIYNTSELNLLEKGFDFAEEAHQGQKRLTGEDFIFHPLRVALTLSKMRLGAKTVTAGLLHDSVEDTSVTIHQIKKKFGEEVAFLVQSLTKIESVKYHQTERDTILAKENFRNMILAMAKDLRVIFIKLADRLDNLKTLWVLPPEKQQRKASETLEIFAPLAYRLGLTKMGAELEDLAFPYVYPQEYKLTKSILGTRKEELEKYLQRLIPIIKRQLQKNHIQPVKILSRAKHLYSIWRKLQKEDMDINRIFDLVAVRIIVEKVEDCYAALGALHQIWKPVPGRFKDYIALPKPNGYQSLHTTVFAEEGKIVEIQIRTQKMDQEAEWGIAAHWFYQLLKDTKIYKKRKKFRLPSKYHWINQLREWQKKFMDSDEFLESLKVDFFKDRIFVLTPKGDIVDLPDGATPIDFAYQIHTDIGNQAISAKVNGKVVPLDYRLKSGEVVEIITQKHKLPSPTWLEFVKMAETKKKIQEILKKKRVLPEADKKNFKVRLKIICQDKIGLLDKILQIIAKQKITILEHHGKTIRGNAIFSFLLKIKSASHLEGLLKKLKKLKGIQELRIEEKN